MSITPRYFYRDREVKVVLSCNGEYCNEKDVEFVDISEDFQGRDKLTFVCPVCGETHTSYRLG